MKKLNLVLISIIFALSMTACSPVIDTAPMNDAPTPEPIINISPYDAFSLADAQSIVTYHAVASDTSANTVTYHSDPIGQGDTVIVSVAQPSDIRTKDNIRALYDQTKSMRPTAETLEGIGEDAFIAYPTVHVYMDGYHVSVSAGSGSGDAQHELLIKVAGIVEKNLKNILQNNIE